MSFVKDFRTNPFFNLLEVTPCLLVKPVRKKVENVLCLIKKIIKKNQLTMFPN